MDSPENQAAGADAPEADPEETPSPAEVLSAALLLGAGATAIQHPVIYIKLLIQVGYEPLPPTWGTTLFGRRVLYWPGLFSYAQHIVQVDGKRGLFRGLPPHLVCSAVSTVVKRRVKQMELISAKEEQETSLRALVKDTSHEMLVRCLCRVACHPFHVLSVRCMAQFVGKEAKYSGMLSGAARIFNEEGLGGFYVGLVPLVLGELLHLWGSSLLCHFISSCADDDDDTFIQASAIRSYTKCVMSMAVGVLRYPFTLVADLMTLNDCGLAAGRPPVSPVHRSWLDCWTHLMGQGDLLRGCSLFFRRARALAALER